MELVKFSSKDKNERLFVNTLRKNVHDYFKENQLSPKANFAMVVKTIVMISLYIVPYILILSIGMPSLLAAGLTVLMGIGIAGVGMGVMHEACHGAYF